MSTAISPNETPVPNPFVNKPDAMARISAMLAFAMAKSLANAPMLSTRATLIRQHAAILTAIGAFDPIWYCEKYEAIRNADIDPAMHYVEYGVFEGRLPLPPARLEAAV